VYGTGYKFNENSSEVKKWRKLWCKSFLLVFFLQF
jgi:hypothetical protein